MTTTSVPRRLLGDPDEGAPDADCVVVGAGPVGLLTALLLGRRGWRVHVIERWAERYPLPRACTIDHEALRILQAAGVMVDHSDLFEPSRGERGGYQMRNADGTLLRAINWNRTAESGWANTNGFYQPDLEAALEALVEALPSVQVHRGWTVTGLLDDGAAVSVASRPTVATDSSDADATGETAHGEASLPGSIRASWVVAADGANSAMRDLLGIDTDDSGFAADWLVVDYQPRVDQVWDAFVTQYCDPIQPATAVRSGPGRRRFEFMRPAHMPAAELALAETAWKLMAPWNVTPANADLERHAVYTFRGRWAQDWKRGRVFLAGDAAHLMPPFLGQGLCAGLRDARALTWRLDLVRRGLAGDQVLDTYASERRDHVRVVIDEAVAIGRVICETDPTRAAVRDATMLAELDDPTSVTVEPPHPPLGQPSLTLAGTGAEGRLSVQGRVEVAGRTGLFDDLVGGDWQLIGLDVDPLDSLPDDLLAWFVGIGGRVATVGRDAEVRDVDGTYAGWFEAHDCAVVLARPDFYVFGTGSSTDCARLVAGLRHQLSTIPAGQTTGIVTS